MKIEEFVRLWYPGDFDKDFYTYLESSHLSRTAAIGIFVGKVFPQAIAARDEALSKMQKHLCSVMLKTDIRANIDNPVGLMDAMLMYLSFDILNQTEMPDIDKLKIEYETNRQD